MIMEAVSAPGEKRNALPGQDAKLRRKVRCQVPGLAI